MYTEDEIKEAYQKMIGFIEEETGRAFSELADFEPESLLLDLLDVLSGVGHISEELRQKENNQ